MMYMERGEYISGFSVIIEKPYIPDQKNICITEIAHYHSQLFTSKLTLIYLRICIILIHTNLISLLFTLYKKFAYQCN
jgi:hypothetical protein